MVATFLAPISAGFKINKTEAQATARTEILPIVIDQTNTTDKRTFFNVTIKNTKDGYLEEKIGFTGSRINILNYKLYSELFDINEEEIPEGELENGTADIRPNEAEQTVSFYIDNLVQGSTYFLLAYLREGSTNEQTGTVLGRRIKSGISFTAGTGGDITQTSATDPIQGYNITCGVLDLGFGCLIGIVYGIWEASAWFARLGGHFLDFFVYYSTNSSSYGNTFVDRAWGGVRDIVNMFFIVALLYVAIRTILNIHVSDNKKIIGKVIIVALLINFSLFATKLVIDTSNILAKVFYNNITSKDSDGKILENPGKEKSISVGLVEKFNPQEIISTPQEYLKSKGTFLFITILAIAITLYTGYIFFSVALLFVARVVSLWIAMITSPVAFISIALPFNIPGMGHDNWVKNLLENAFLAPIFIFFLYIIVLFAGFLKAIPDIYAGDKADIIQHIMGVAVPFLLIVGLLQKAKKMAVEYAGEMGAQITSWGAKVAGLALGAAGGAAALGLSGTLGKLASKITGGETGALGNTGEKLRDLSNRAGFTGSLAKFTLKNLDRGAGASFDVRKSLLGDLAAEAGLNTEKYTKYLRLEGTKTVGYKARVAAKKEKIEKEFELHKTKLSNTEVKEMYTQETTEYDETKRQERKKLGNKFNEKDFIKTFGNKPPQTTEELNIKRQKEFAENIGRTGLMYTAAYEVAKRTLGEDASKETIDKRARNIRLAIGTAGMSLVTGLATGGLGFVPGALGGFGKSMTLGDAQRAAESSVTRDVEKKQKILEKIQALEKKEEELKKLVIEGEEENLKKIEKIVANLENSKTGKTPGEIKAIDEEIIKTKNRTLDDHIIEELADVEMNKTSSVSERKIISDEIVELQKRKREAEQAARNNNAENDPSTIGAMERIDDKIKERKTTLTKINAGYTKDVAMKEFRYKTMQNAQDKIVNLTKAIADTAAAEKAKKETHGPEVSRPISTPSAGGSSGHATSGGEKAKPSAGHGH